MLTMNAKEYGLSEGPMVKGNGYKPPNLHRWGPGVRDVYALHYIVSGRGYLKTSQAVYPLEAGDSFIIFPQMEVYYYPDPQDPWAYCWIECGGAEALRLLEMIHMSPITLLQRRCSAGPQAPVRQSRGECTGAV